MGREREATSITADACYKDWTRCAKTSGCLGDVAAHASPRGRDRPRVARVQPQRLAGEWPHEEVLRQRQAGGKARADMPLA